MDHEIFRDGVMHETCELMHVFMIIHVPSQQSLYGMYSTWRSSVHLTTINSIENGTKNEVGEKKFGQFNRVQLVSQNFTEKQNLSKLARCESEMQDLLKMSSTCDLPITCLRTTLIVAYRQHLDLHLQRFAIDLSCALKLYSVNSHMAVLRLTIIL